MTENNGTAPDVRLERDAILGIVDLKLKQIKVKQWEREIWIRELTAYARMRVFIVDHGSQDPSHRAALLCAYGISDKDGNLIFDETHAEDLKAKNYHAITFISNQIMELSGINKKGKKKAKKPQEKVKKT